jgi:osmotically-inducible protein OsmY
MQNRFATWLLAAAVALASPSMATAAQPLRTKQVALEVESALLRLPYYDVFDNLGYEVAGHGTVILTGQVRTPWLKDSAEKAVKRVAGVDTVVNNIEVLPASISDDRIRAAVYRSMFRDTSLYRYALGANPSIRIVVKNGRVTLEGFVANEMDKTIAGMKARQVFGVFEVTNNLSVDKS